MLGQRILFAFFVFGLPVVFLGTFLYCNSYESICKTKKEQKEERQTETHKPDSGTRSLNVLKQNDGSEHEPKAIDGQASFQCSTPCQIVKNTLDDPVAIFTAVLSYFVLLQVYWVIRQESTTRVQGRAYVFVTKAEIINLDNDKTPEIKIVMTNTGKTPAYKLTQWTNFRLYKGQEFGPPNPLPRMSKTNIGPSGQFMKVVPLPDGPIPTDSLPNAKKNLLSGQTELWIWGHIAYSDAFKKLCFTNLRMYFNGSKNPSDCPLIVAEEGNETEQDEHPTY